MAKLQIGQIGCGHWGRYVLRDLLLLGTDVHLVEKSTESKERLRNEGYSVCDTLNDLPEVDAYVIVSPTSTHAELISQIIDQNKPIFCEKPLCNSYEDAQKLNTHNNKDIFIMDKWHYHAGIIELGKIVKSGELGKVIGLRSKRVQWGQPHKDVSSIWTLMPHELTISREILGYLPELRSVNFEGGREFLEGCICRFGEAPWFITEISTLYPNKDRFVRLLCENGIAIMDDPMSDHIKVFSDPNPRGQFNPELRPIDNQMPLYLELECFLKFVKGGPAPKARIDEALETIELIERIHRIYNDRYS